MNVFLVEDEAPARERLIETIGRVEPAARIAGTAASVREARAWLAANPAPDLMLLDVQLADGLSFELFAPPGQVACPTIFATAYDEFVLEAFRANAIDYVLKPVSDDALARAFAGYRRLKRHFGADVARAAAELAAGPSRPRQRILGRSGGGFVPLALDEIAWFVSVDKATWAVGNDGRRHLVEPSLAELEAELEPERFFRINRQVIVAAAAVRGFRPSGKGRLALELAPAATTTLSVTPERAAAFRAWLGA
jgi:DNA-binding LytR/AlgR family response regulator